MSEVTQTVAVQPAAFASAFAQYNPISRYQVKPFHKLFVLFCSLPKTGKSCLLESNPNLLRLDFDRAGTTNPQTRATTIPAVQDGGGKPVVITKDFIDNVVGTLCDLATKDKPRPQVVAFDTIDSMLNVLAPARAHQLGLKSFADADVKEWGVVYDWAADYFNALVQHGYGVWLTTHIVNKKLEINERAKMILDTTVSITFINRFRGLLDLICAVERGIDTTMKPIPKIHPVTKQPALDGKGQPLIERMETVETPFVDLILRQSKPTSEFDPDFSRLVCGRVGGLPDRMRLPRIDAWPLVAKKYEETAVADGAALLT